MSKPEEIVMETDCTSHAETATNVISDNIASDAELRKDGRTVLGQKCQNVVQQPTLNIKEFSMKGKGIFSMQPKYQPQETINAEIKTFSVKAYDEDSKQGLGKVWEQIVGYSKKQLLIEEGYLYIFTANKEGLVRNCAHELTKLLKIFYDDEQKSMRLVFLGKDKKMITKNYQAEGLSDFVDKLLLEVHALGLELFQDQM